MFDALEMSLKVLERLAPIETRIRRKSASLAKQLADASESVALNLGEGSSRRDGDKRRHFEMAAGSASEVTVALRIAGPASPGTGSVRSGGSGRRPALLVA